MRGCYQIMKKLLLGSLLLFSQYLSMAQVPNFAGTAGKNQIYGYFSAKARPGVNSQETYSVIEYGVNNWLATGADLYTDTKSTYLGYVVRFGKLCLSKYLNVGAQVGPSFNMSDNFNFSYLTSALYLNGNIIEDGNLFYVADTWYTINQGHINNSIDEWFYLAYKFKLKNGDGITPMVGSIYSWKFNTDMDLSAGAYYTRG